MRLKTIEGMDTRPTTDRIKETLFNMIQPSIADSRFLDLFAGSGGIGIEALSRGASWCVFVEQQRKAAECIRENLAFTRLKEDATLLVTDAVSAVNKLDGEDAFSWIFMDPPYGKGLEFQVLEALQGTTLVDEDTQIIIEESLDVTWERAEELGYEIIKEIQVKSARISEKKRRIMTTAVYPGSFDPVTNGHLDVISRGAELFDKVIVGVLHNSTKSPLFSVEERVRILNEAIKDLPNVEIVAFSGLSVDFARQCKAKVIIRGLRAITDFEYELQMAQTNRVLAPDVDTMFLTTSLEYAYLSSTTVKEVAAFGGDISKFVPGFVMDEVHKKLKK